MKNHDIVLKFLHINATTIHVSTNLYLCSSSFQHCTLGFEFIIHEYLLLFLHLYCTTFSYPILF